MPTAFSAGRVCFSDLAQGFAASASTSARSDQHCSISHTSICRAQGKRQADGPTMLDAIVLPERSG